MEAHATGALHDRFHDHCGQLVGVRLDQLRQVPDVVRGGTGVEAGWWSVGEDLLRKHAAPQAVHATRIADEMRSPRTWWL